MSLQYGLVRNKKYDMLCHDYDDNDDDDDDIMFICI